MFLAPQLSDIELSWEQLTAAAVLLLEIMGEGEEHFKTY